MTITMNTEIGSHFHRAKRTVGELVDTNEAQNFIWECDALMYWKKAFSISNRDIAFVRKLQRMAKKIIHNLPPETDERGWMIERGHAFSTELGYKMAVKDGCTDIKWENSFVFYGYGDGVEVCYCEGDYVKLTKLNS